MSGDLALFALRDGKYIRLAPTRDDGDRPRAVHQEALTLLTEVLALVGPCAVVGAGGKVVLIAGEATLKSVGLPRSTELERGARTTLAGLDPSGWWSDVPAPAPKRPQGRDVGDGVFEEVGEPVQITLPSREAS